MPVGRWVIRTAESVVFTCWPPAPDDRIVSIRRSFGSIATSTASASGSTATVAAEVWMRPPDSVSGTRWTRCTPLSNFSRAKTPRPRSGRRPRAMPPSSVACSSTTSKRQPLRVGIALVHAQEIGGEERRLLAAGAGPDLEDRRPRIGGVLGQKREPHRLLGRLAAGRAAAAVPPRPAPASRDRPASPRSRRSRRAARDSRRRSRRPACISAYSRLSAPISAAAGPAASRASRYWKRPVIWSSLSAAIMPTSIARRSRWVKAGPDRSSHCSTRAWFTPKSLAAEARAAFDRRFPRSSIQAVV